MGTLRGSALMSIHVRSSKQSGILGATMFCSCSLGTTQNGRFTSAPRGNCGKHGGAGGRAGRRQREGRRASDEGRSTSGEGRRDV